MRTPCPFCGAVISACNCEADYLSEVDTEDLKAELARRETESGDKVDPC